MPMQTYVAPGRLEPRVKASQCFTKYKWRDLDSAKRQSGPQIVATQVITQSRMLHGDISETEPLTKQPCME